MFFERKIVISWGCRQPWWDECRINTCYCETRLKYHVAIWPAYKDFPTSFFNGAFFSENIQDTSCITKYEPFNQIFGQCIIHIIPLTPWTPWIASEINLNEGQGKLEQNIIWFKYSSLSMHGDKILQWPLIYNFYSCIGRDSLIFCCRHANPMQLI